MDDGAVFNVWGEEVEDEAGEANLILCDAHLFEEVSRGRDGLDGPAGSTLRTAGKSGDGFGKIDEEARRIFEPIGLDIDVARNGNSDFGEAGLVLDADVGNAAAGLGKHAWKQQQTRQDEASWEVAEC